jgi:NAD(P)-dependent dehydrogenase (short-subunit alcohol dehydrogenase family)
VVVSSEERVVVVTGGTGALGAAICAAFRAEGATVVATSHGGEAREGPSGERIVPVDLRDEVAVAALAMRVRDEHGAPDALVCSAGGYASGRAVETDAQAWRAQLELNATTAYVACTAFLPAMLERGSGQIVLVGSRAAVRPFAGAVAYIASKAAVVALGQALAAETRDAGVRVNVVLPSTIDTPANRAASPGADFASWVAPASLAEAIAWLSAPGSRDINGAVLPVYGNA